MWALSFLSFYWISIFIYILLLFLNLFCRFMCSPVYSLSIFLSLSLTLSLSGVHVFVRTWFFHYYFILRTFLMTMVCVSCCCCCVYPLNSSKSPLSIETDSNCVLCIFNVEFHNFESNSIFRPSRFSRLVETLFNIIPLARFIDHALDYI